MINPAVDNKMNQSKLWSAARRCAGWLLLIMSMAWQVPANATETSTLGLPPLDVYEGYTVARGERDQVAEDGGPTAAPVPGVKLYVGGKPDRFTFSSDEGRYVLVHYGVGCPYTTYSYKDIIAAEFYPHLRPKYPLFTAANTYIPITVDCLGLGAYAQLAPNLTTLTTHIQLDSILSGLPQERVHHLDILMDTMFIVGAVRFRDGSGNPLPVREELEYDNFGLLSAITREALEDTTIYVFNRRTNELIAEQSLLSATDDDATFQIPILGPDYNRVYRTMAEAGLTWTSAAVFPDYSSEMAQAASRARPGDEVEVIAVNRTTGYLGSKIAKLESIGHTAQPGETDQDLTLVIIDMLPPNLKIKAERVHTIEHGTTAGEERAYLIGAESSALATDQVIRITTEWTAPGGGALSSQIPGFTGRLAKIVKDNQTPGPDLSEVAAFDILPGFHQQWIHTPTSSVVNDHYYLHICARAAGLGTPCDFTSIRTQEPLIYRPRQSVPFRIVEKGIRLTGLAGDADATDTDQDGIANFYEEQLGTDPFSASSVPADADRDGIPDALWIYRPELHFSVYDLNVENIRLLEEGSGSTVNVYSPNDTAVISWEDQRIDIQYRLRSPDNGAGNLQSLPRLGPPREMEFAFGDETVAATLDQNDTVSFINLMQLADALEQATPADYLSLRLLQSSDAGNVLWEWAFETLAVDVDVDSDNNNGTDTPERSDREDEIENIAGNNAEFPGKLFSVHEGDVDGDSLPDFADFSQSAPFVPIVIEIPETLDIGTGQIRFIYQASDPTGVVEEGDLESGFVYLPAPGYLRLWTVDGNTNRDTAGVANGGHFVPTDTLFDPADFGLNNDNREFTLYVEAVRWSQSVADMKLEFEFIEGP